MDIEDAIRLNVCAMAVQVFIGGEHERESILNMTKMVDLGTRYGIPTLAVTAVGKDMKRDARYFRLATRICAELGAHYVKTYYVEEGFETVTAACPGAHRHGGRQEDPGARRPDHGLQGRPGRAPRAWTWAATSSSPTRPIAMIQAVRAVVHRNETPEKRSRSTRAAKE